MKRVYETSKNENYFFGYYDKSPLNSDNAKLLAQRNSFIGRMPTKDDHLEIGYFAWQNSNEFIKIAETRAWNWQQGCMLQWLGTDFNSKIIYNDRVKDKFVSIVMDVNSREKKVLPMSIYTVSKDGRFALCIDNERHYWFRGGYSYQGVENFDKKKSIDQEDGIWLLDIETKSLKQIITLKTLLSIKPLSIMKNGVHYIEHLMVSPNGKRFCFLHRWSLEDGGIYARFYTANTDGSDVYLLNDSGRMSHFCWRDNKELFGWGGMENSINALRKYKKMSNWIIKPLMPLYRNLIGGNSVDGNSKLSAMINGDGYIVFVDKSKHKSKLNSNKLNKDGHPSFCPEDRNMFVSDTYPQINNNYQQDLFLFDITNDRYVHIDSLSHPEEISGTSWRCDLHPKWSYDGKYIVVDAIENDHRKIILYKVDNAS